MNRSEELCKLLGIKGNPYVDYQPNVISTKYAYPDLTKPSNFVKLLDLLNAYLDIRCDCLMAVVPQIIDKAIFLASTNSSRFIDKKDKFKKQAQATKWDY